MPDATPTPPEQTAASVRQRYIEFFTQRAHTFVPSSTTVPTNDPSLRDTFANAGMNQYKPLFLGQVTPGSYLEGLTRAVNSQKCIRAGGKHNDLDDVGKDTYHHTFFEMLGNWSFGDYFKAEAIAWSWEFLTAELGLDPNHLYATYFGGDEDAGLEPDLEAKQLWLKYLPPERVLPGDMKDNFWEMGDTGPCGPCSEVHYDSRPDAERQASPGRALVNNDHPSVIELWNLVFIQFERLEGGKLRNLPAKHVDTGMGLERIVRTVQGKDSNYDTDVFTPLFDRIRELTKARAYTGKVGADDTDGVDEAYRVIADHVRTLVIAITDGGVPGNEGRGYVLRRILRRAVRYGRQKLGAPEGFLADLAPTVVEQLGDAFPELREKPEHVIAIIRDEEDSFGRTLEKGTRLFNTSSLHALNKALQRFDSQLDTSLQIRLEIRSPGEPRFIPLTEVLQSGTSAIDSNSLLRKASLQTDAPIGDPITLTMWTSTWTTGITDEHPTISGDDAFKLYDTYGFPVDLTRIMAEERGLRVDLEGFERAMDEQKARSRAGGRKTEKDALALGPEELAQLARLKVKATDDSHKFHAREIRATVKAIWNGHNFDEHATALSQATKPIGIILDKTNFYAEMGGQVADLGRLFVTRDAHTGDQSQRGGEQKVTGVVAFGGYVLHTGPIVRGELRVGDDVVLHIDPKRRLATASNHTATHLLNHKLRKVLGGTIDQRGSLVDPEKLRFDFTHNEQVEAAQLGEVEAMVRADVEADLRVYADLGSLETAKRIHGLRAVFDETYPDPVRIVSIGEPVDALLEAPESEAWGERSIEFCGGTHLESTGQAEAFALVSEEGIAKGVRRIVALTGVPARAAIAAADELDQRVDDAEKRSGGALSEAVQELNTEIDAMTLPAARKAALRARVAELAEKVKAAQKEAAKARAAQAQQQAEQFAAAASSSMEPIVVATLELGSDRKALETALKTIQAKCPAHGVIVLSPDEDEGKVAVMASVPKALVDRGLRAGDWIRATTAVLGGKGGGKPEMAQGGGTDVAKLKDALKTARTFAIGAIS